MILADRTVMAPNLIPRGASMHQATTSGASMHKGTIPLTSAARGAKANASLPLPPLPLPLLTKRKVCGVCNAWP